MGFGVWGLGFGVWGLGFGLWALGFGEVSCENLRRAWDVQDHLGSEFWALNPKL